MTAPALRVLHLEDDRNDAALVAAELERTGIACEIVRVDNVSDFVRELSRGHGGRGALRLLHAVLQRRGRAHPGAGALFRRAVPLHLGDDRRGASHRSAQARRHRLRAEAEPLAAGAGRAEGAGGARGAASPRPRRAGPAAPALVPAAGDRHQPQLHVRQGPAGPLHPGQPGSGRGLRQHGRERPRQDGRRLQPQPRGGGGLPARRSRSDGLGGREDRGRGSDHGRHRQAPLALHGQAASARPGWRRRPGTGRGARHHRAQGGRGPAPAGPEDGRDRRARGRRGPRLQQPSRRDHRLRRPAAEGHGQPASRGPAAGADPQGGRPRHRPHPAAAGLQPQADPAAAGPRSQRRGQRRREDARPADRRDHPKEKGKGTGLGLSTAYGIVKQSGGTITVSSEAQRGTTFKVYLPQVEEPLDVAAEAPAEEPPAPAAETVLLVEDEPSLRSMIQEILAEAAYTVLACATPEDAVGAARSHPGPIHLLLTDVMMPRLGGRELALQLAALRPGLRVLYMSGYTDEVIVHHGIDAGRHFLQKPFTSDALLGRVRDLLRGAENSAP